MTRSIRSILCSFVCLACLVVTGCSEGPTNVGGATPGPSVTPTSADVAQGKHQVFTTPAPLHVPGWPSAAVKWSNLSGPGAGYVSPRGVYYAPLTLAADRSVTLEAEYGGKTSVEVRLTTGPVDSADCFAIGQQPFKLGDYVFIEVLPEAITRVAPAYPDSARNAGVDGTVQLLALVCACGEVSDVRVMKSIPMLDAAAVAAVRQWKFKPALSNGDAAAVWVGIPVKFTLH